MAEGGSFQVRTFLSVDEIHSEPGFLEDALFVESEYHTLVGDYRFPDRLRCCLKSEERGRCSATHNWGFVIRLKDSTVTLVGNKCGNDKFGAESMLSADRKAYAKEKERQAAVSRLRELLATRQATEAAADEIYQRLRVMCERGKAWLGQAGFHAEKRILEMSKRESGAVPVAGIRVREYLEDGRTKTERTPIEVTAGSLPGLLMFRKDLVIDVHADIRKAQSSYRDAEKLDDSTTTTKVLREFISRMGLLDEAMVRGRQYLDAEKAFQAADWTCLPFLARESDDRIRLAQMALEHAGLPKAKDKAKAYINKLEADLKARYGVQEIQIL